MILIHLFRANHYIFTAYIFCTALVAVIARVVLLYVGEAVCFEWSERGLTAQNNDENLAFGNQLFEVIISLFLSQNMRKILFLGDRFFESDYFVLFQNF